MFDIGFLELMLIGIVGLLVLGPERLPKAARTTGMWIGKIKRSVAGIQREINAQLEAEELRQKLAEQQKKLDAGLAKARAEVERQVEAPPRSSAVDKPVQASGTVSREADASPDTPAPPRGYGAPVETAALTGQQKRSRAFEESPVPEESPASDDNRMSGDDRAPEPSERPRSPENASADDKDASSR
ncbi:Sec-independent protein translocase protein TatB [Halomonas shantousis]